MVNPQQTVAPEIFGPKYLTIYLVSLALPPLGLALFIYWIIRKRQGRNYAASLTIIITLALSLVGTSIYAYAYFSTHNKNTGVQEASGLGSLSDYKLDGASPGKGIAFKKPSNLSKISPDSKIAVTFVLPDKASTDFIGTAVDVRLYPVTGQYNPKFTINSILTDPKSTQYRIFTSGFQNYLKERLQKLFYQSGQTAAISLQAGKPQTYSNDNLKSSDALVFNFTASYFPAKGVTLSPELSRSISGQMVIAYSSGVYYYFIAGADSTQWRSNVSLWASIFSSIRINQ